MGDRPREPVRAPGASALAETGTRAEGACPPASVLLPRGEALVPRGEALVPRGEALASQSRRGCKGRLMCPATPRR